MDITNPVRGVSFLTGKSSTAAGVMHNSMRKLKIKEEGDQLYQVNPSQLF